MYKSPTEQTEFIRRHNPLSSICNLGVTPMPERFSVAKISAISESELARRYLQIKQLREMVTQAERIRTQTSFRAESKQSDRRTNRSRHRANGLVV